MSEQIGFSESVSLAVGGMVGGGIFAVLGVVAVNAGTAAWLAFAASGVLALCAAYSFQRLHDASDATGGPVEQIEDLTGRRDVAGLTGWLFTFGYVGTMAMYAFAFGSYALELVGVHSVLGVPARPLVSVAGVALFAGLNAAGARASGRTEDALVAAKVAILLVVGVGGLYYGLEHHTVASGFDRFSVSAMTAAAIAFVAFEGWELLLFDRDSVADAETTIPRAVYTSIVGTSLLYVLVAVVTTNLVSTSVLQRNPETALAFAAEPFLYQAGFVLVAVAAVLSTASALNATLFSAARLTQSVADVHHGRGQSDRPGGGVGTNTNRTNGSETPGRSLLVLAVLTAILTGYGSLESITSFASGAFITIFGGASALAYREREDATSAVIPAVGAVGAGAALAALFWHLHRTQPDVLVTVATIWALVLTLYWVPRR